jgi:very-short-patch-repair endonuclease
MRALLLATVIERGGVITRAEALRRFPRHVIDDSVRTRQLVVAHPGVYCLSGLVEDPVVRRRAALAYCPRGALSHLDAFALWGLPTTEDPRIHLTVPGEMRAFPSASLRVHRRRGFCPEPPSVVERDGMRVVRLEQAIVESWPLLSELDRRAPAIVAVRERRTTAQRLLEVLEGQRASGAREQRTLYSMLSVGTHSELEIWGHERVFSDPRLPKSVAQHRIEVGGRVMFLDRAFLAEMVAVELDGAAFHGSPRQRELDVRRDAIAARVGWLTVRYAHRRLHADPDGVVVELLDILARRRTQLAS